MRAGGAYAHSALALDTISHYEAEHAADHEASSDAGAGHAEAGSASVR
jgi:hypothetical protein